MKAANIAARILPIALCCLLAGCQTPPPPEKPGLATQTNAATTPTPSVEPPLLRCAIESLSMYPVPNSPRDLAISLVVSVRNSGSASLVKDWTLTVDAANLNDHPSLEPVHVKGVVEMPGAPGKRVDLDKEDLAVKTKAGEVAKGAQISGILTFVLPKASSQDFSNNNASLVLHFKDSQGKAYQSPPAKIVNKR